MKKTERQLDLAPRRCAMRLLPVAAAAGIALAGGTAGAMEIDTGNPDISVRWDTTVKYGAAVRLKKPDAALLADPGFDDGDRSTKRGGLISNRFDLFSELDVRRGSFGLRVSGAAWYDDVYNRSNDFETSAPFAGGYVPPNHSSVADNEYPDDVRKLQGRKAEVLDAYVFGKVDAAGMPLSFRLGRYTLMYGESLFFGGNGIANAQVPIDVIKAVSVPNSQFKEIGMPVGQLSAQWQLSKDMSLGAYYHLEWRKYRLPGANTYFSTVDAVDAGAESFFPGGVAPRTPDQKAPNHGEFGAQFKFKLPGSFTEYGLYAARYHEKLPIAMIALGILPGVGPVPTGYSLVYPQRVTTYGASFSTVVSDTNVSGEVSYRHNTPITPPGGAVAVFSPAFNGSNNPAYPTGNSFHAQVSAVTLLPASPLWDGATVIGELAFNRRLSYKVNHPLNPVDPNTTRDASGLRVAFEPQYFQVLPQLDLSVPIGLGYAIDGQSSVFSFGPRHGGDFTIGVKAEYAKTWRASLQLTHFFGKAAPLVVGGALSFRQTMKDRDFVSLSIQRTF